MCREKFWHEAVFLKGCSFLKLNSEIVPKFFELSVPLLSSKSVETVFFVSIPILKISIYFWPKFIDPYWFLTAVKKYLVFWQKKFGKVVKTSFHVSTKALEAVMFVVENFLRIIFDVWAEKFFVVREKFIFGSWSPLNFSEKKFFCFRKF